jgi:methylamine dehydrogenase accessory protein MauD
VTLVWTVIIVLAVVVILLAVTVVALGREIGLLARRLPPAPALDAQDGPELGVAPMLIEATTMAGKPVILTGADSDPKVLLFVSTTCQACRELIADVPGILRDWPGETFIVVVSGTRGEVKKVEPRLAGLDVVWDERSRISERLGISGLPLTLLLDPGGRVVARGVTNNREMVSSLLQGRIRVLPADVWVEETVEQP